MPQQGTSKLGEVNIRITDKHLAKLINRYCDAKKLGYTEFATDVLLKFFSEPKVLLETKTKDELIEMILKEGEMNEK